MPMKLVINSANPSVGALIIVEIVRKELNSDLQVVWSTDFGKNLAKLQFFGSNGKILGERSSDVARYLSRAHNAQLYGSNDPFDRTEVDHWLTFADKLVNHADKDDCLLLYLDQALAPRTWLVAKHLTIADICVFSKIYYQEADEINDKYQNLSRWYDQMLSLPEVQKVLSLVSKNTTVNPTAATKSKRNDVAAPKSVVTRKQEGKFVDLPGAEMGKVIVRFPPEASGYLHIGHAKAALLNQYYAENFQGQLIMRFDDTNPAKENVEFEKAILEDLTLLRIKPDRFTHSSDYFDIMLEYCEKLLKESKAFVDDTPAQQMKEQRDQKLPSANRDNSVENNLSLWKEMVEGTARGQECCVRAKIDYQSANGCLRDPTIYRCKSEPHPRTGTKYKVYPTYDFACPIVDAIENVTHTLRTTEYHDRDDQFYWFVDALKLNRPHIWEYSRLNMTNTVLSKRKLTWFVSEGLVDGWDDPRFPTVRGILRRGMTVEGLKQFIIAQGSSRSVVFMEWDKIWAINKKVIDPIAIRYTALDSGKTIPVNVKGVTADCLTVANHPKDPALGTKQVQIASTVLIEAEDAEALREGQNATFINWGNLLIEKILKKNGKVVQVDASLNLDNKDYKNFIAKDTRVGILM
ncbi:PREDICTED: bifunctional glutamate/proline--tRNA ligase-like [Ceratosolen solmsi marchali]|uniref:glutamate--tRNA ligase n=1 Tax=Ceratosolen solmsi marchali TaxID=326594 RepID=A0AAJ7DWE8_9HYME|nr:PREDICTED: bifunctional glutamate/proline--tRNA ligase-like [Ceratosolen solmsi marchali]